MTYQDRHLPQLAKDFCAHRDSVLLKSKNTTEAYAKGLEMFFDWFVKEKNLQKTLAEVTLDDIKTIQRKDANDFMVYVRNQPNKKNPNESIATSTVIQRVQSLISFWKYLVNNFLVDKHIFMDFEFPDINDREESKYLSYKDALKFIEAVKTSENPIRDYAIVMMFLNTGLRRSELTNIKLTDIVGNKLMFIKKGGKKRAIKLNPSVLTAIIDYLEIRPKIDSPYLWISRENRHINKNTIYSLIKVAFKKIGITEKGYSPHTLRHSCATILYSNGESISEIQDLLGHTTSRMTKEYAHEIEDEEFKTESIVDRNPFNQLFLKAQLKLQTQIS